MAATSGDWEGVSWVLAWAVLVLAAAFGGVAVLALQWLLSHVSITID